MYFLSLVPQMAVHEPRLIGWSPEPFKPEDLTEDDTEGRYYTYAVQERYPKGLWRIGWEVSWWKFEEGSWKPCEKPKTFEKITGWAM